MSLGPLRNSPAGLLHLRLRRARFDQEYESNGKTGKRWTKIGAAFPHKEGIGFSIELKAFPVDGRLVVLPPDTDDNRK